MSRRQRTSQGFTLIEVLVAVTVLAIVAVLGWQGLDGIVKARFALNGQLDQTRGLQITFAQLQNDLARITDPEDIKNRPNLFAEPGRLTLVRNVFAENQPSQVQVVAYRVADGVLVRRESAPVREFRELDRTWQAVVADADRNTAVPLQPQVAAMDFRTWAGKSGWQPAGGPPGGNPNNQQMAQPPSELRGVEVSLRLDGNARSLVKVFLLGAE